MFPDRLSFTYSSVSLDPHDHGPARSCAHAKHAGTTHKDNKTAEASRGETQHLSNPTYMYDLTWMQMSAESRHCTVIRWRFPQSRDRRMHPAVGLPLSTATLCLCGSVDKRSPASYRGGAISLSPGESISWSRSAGDQPARFFELCELDLTPRRGEVVPAKAPRKFGKAPWPPTKPDAKCFEE